MKKRAGLELFPSESSGYDSSASSTVGDTLTRSSDEDLRDDINHNKVKINVKHPDPPPIFSTPQNTRNEVKRKLENEIEQERRRLQSEHEKLKREADALQEERKKFEEEKKLLRSTMSKSTLSNSKSISNLQDIGKHQESSASDSKNNNVSNCPSDVSGTSSSSGSLAAALQLEIKRRKQKAAGTSSVKTVTEPASGSSVAAKKAPFITDKNEKHDMLIAEFKKAHKKMFTSSTEASEDEPIRKGIMKCPTDSTPTSTLSSIDSKPKAPPPPPMRSSYPLSSNLQTPSSSSSESLGKNDGNKTNTLLTVINTPASKPGIPTPDYDSTPDRSPAGRRKLFTKHRPTHSKHITPVAPPTVESIQRAKSLTALNNIDDMSSKTAKSKAPAPNPLRSADSMTDLRISPPRPKEPPPKIPTKMDLLQSNSSILSSSRSSSQISSFQPEFFKRHPDLDNLEKHSPPGYFNSSINNNIRSSPATSLNSYHSQSEPKRFEFLPKPCDPNLIPAKETGEEARIASKDYRGTINSNKIYNIGELPNSSSSSKQKTVKSEHKSIRELSEKTARSFGLKKAPAPMPPVLRK